MTDPVRPPPALIRLLPTALAVLVAAGTASCGGGIGTEAESPDGDTRVTVKPVPATESEPYEHPATVSPLLIRELLTRETPRLRFSAEAISLELRKAGPQHIIGLCEWRDQECVVDLKLYVRGGELHYVGRDIDGGSRSVDSAMPLSSSHPPVASAAAPHGGCSSDQECKGGRTCLGGACVEPTPGCRSNVDCKGSRVCHLGKCVSSAPPTSASAPPPPPPPTPPEGGCSSDARCQGTRVGRDGHCVAP